MGISGDDRKALYTCDLSREIACGRDCITHQSPLHAKADQSYITFQNKEKTLAIKIFVVRTWSTSHLFHYFTK